MSDREGHLVRLSLRFPSGETTTISAPSDALATAVADEASAASNGYAYTGTSALLFACMS